MNSSGQAEVAELADAQASGACAPQGRGGSNPPFRTKFPSNSRRYAKGAAMIAAPSDRFVPRITKNSLQLTRLKRFSYV